MTAGVVGQTAAAAAAAAQVAADCTQQGAAPPLAHAIGGSLGSALALLLFYPLERARIELQASAANNAVSPPALPEATLRRPSTALWSENNRANTIATPSSKIRRRQQDRPRGHSFVGVEKSSSSLSTRGGNVSGVAVMATTTRPPMSSSSLTCLLTNDSWIMQEDPLRVVNSKNNDDEYLENNDDFAGDPSVMLMLQQQQQDKLDQWKSRTAGGRHHHHHSLVVLPEMVVVDKNENENVTDQQRNHVVKAPLSSSSSSSTATTATSSCSSLSSCLIRLWQRNELYRGVGPLVLTMAVSNFIFFYVNALCKNVLVSLMSSKKATGISSSSYFSLVASCLAGIINVLLTNPLWVANLRIVTGQGQQQQEEEEAVLHDQEQSTTLPQTSSLSLTATNRPKSKGSSSAITKLWREMLFVATTGGWMHLWQGTGTSILLVSNPVIQFFLYEQFKVARIRHYNYNNKQNGGGSTMSSSLRLLLLRLLLLLRQGRERPGQSPVDVGSGAATASFFNTKTSLTAAEAFLAGAVAKAIATIVTYPLQLTQSVLRLQQQEEQDSSNNNSRDDKDDEAEMTPSTFASSPLDSSKSSTSSTSSSCLPMSPYRGTWDCLCRLYQRDGIAGLFTGMPTKLLQTVLTAAFTFLTYEQILRAAQSALSLLDVQQQSQKREEVPPRRL